MDGLSFVGTGLARLRAAIGEFLIRNDAEAAASGEAVLAAARKLDADEVGRRADERQREDGERAATAGPTRE
jgi:hypothetical protein